MKELKIKLSAITAVQRFVKVVTDFDGDVDLRAGSDIVDAKSILGIFSLDLSSPVYVIVDNDDDANELFPKLEKFKA